MSNDKSREAFSKYAITNNLITVGKDNLASGVRDLDKHRAAFHAGYESAQQHQEPLEDAEDNYAGAMADLDSIVAAYRKRMPDDEWLNLNYPVGRNKK